MATRLIERPEELRRPPGSRGLHESAGLTNDLDCLPQPEIVAQQHYFTSIIQHSVSHYIKLMKVDAS